MDMDTLKAECLACTRCELCATRTNVVFGQGVLDAEVLFVGEGPGQSEDEQGLPFVGRSGQLRPTKGRPCSSSLWPGPSPTNSTSASGTPCPNTTFVRVAHSSHRVQARHSAFKVSISMENISFKIRMAVYLQIIIL